jgi:hypothetical protein
MSLVHQHACRGVIHTVTLKRAYIIKGDQLEPSPEKPRILAEPVVTDDRLETEQDAFPKLRFTDVILRGTIHAPDSTPATSLVAGLRIGKVERAVQVTGQRVLQVRGGKVSFSKPEPFTSVPFTWEEAYGGIDAACEKEGDLWDIAKLSQAFGKDMSDMNLNRYRRNPLGKGYLLTVKPEHDGYPLPRLEFANDLLTPERIVTGAPVNWFFQPSPACFDWVHYAWYPRIAFMGGKLFDKAGAGVPDQPLPEYAFGFTRDELFAREEAQKLARHPRMLNGAHPAMQLPSFEGSQDITLLNLEPGKAEQHIRYEAKAPRVHLETPGESKTYRKSARLSQLVIDNDAKTLTETWHAVFRAQAPILGPDAEDKVRYDVRGT